MGSMIPRNDKKAISGSAFDGSSIPTSVRGKLQVCLGGPDDDFGSACTARTGSGKMGKMVEQSPEEGKKSGKLRRTIRETVIDLYGYKKTGTVFPPFIRCRFKILEKYKYSQDQAESVTYIFGEKKDLHEVLFNRGTRQMDREDFGTLLPGNEPSDYLMELMAFKIAWIQNQLNETTFWSLPVIFSIYVQMKELLQSSKEPHLYLIVVDIPKTKIWIFDSFPSHDAAKSRIYAATTVATALDHIIRVGFYDIDVLGQRPPLRGLEPEFVLGIPNMGNPYKDKLWILLWLQMEHYFSKGTFAKPKDHIDNVANKVRMDSAMALVNDFVNELRTDIKKRARKDWDDRRSIQTTTK
ncbi:hypothetical protein PIB30_006260 [Stylosanthes scabra]|uniref:Ubiquitin-like protease family profile domain-containing protein n=1 Tax=Stylosanthes scabra TaxID=79078 RepID=A0ABU6Q5C3_9FABA|nr:hypothetical protein [Stylosanthes scabra]